MEGDSELDEFDVSGLYAIERERLVFVLSSEDVSCDDVHCVIRFPKSSRSTVLALADEGPGIEREREAFRRMGGW